MALLSVFLYPRSGFTPQDLEHNTTTYKNWKYFWRHFQSDFNHVFNLIFLNFNGFFRSIFFVCLLIVYLQLIGRWQRRRATRYIKDAERIIAKNRHFGESNWN